MIKALAIVTAAGLGVALSWWATATLRQRVVWTPAVAAVLATSIPFLA